MQSAGYRMSFNFCVRTRACRGGGEGGLYLWTAMFSHCTRTRSKVWWQFSLMDGFQYQKTTNRKLSKNYRASVRAHTHTHTLYRTAYCGPNGVLIIEVSRYRTVYIYIYICVYIHTYMYINIYIYIYILNHIHYVLQWSLHTICYSV